MILTGMIQTSIKVNEAGTYYEVSMDGTEEKLESASISLNDCLACRYVNIVDCNDCKTCA
jgi:iron only hydrogenase large subunit-like protein